MWFPTHIRQANQQSELLLKLLLAVVGISVSGCAWQIPMTRFAPDPTERSRPMAESEDASSERDPRIAGSSSWRGAVTAPNPFQWKSAAESAGGRPIQTMTIGQGGYRVLVIGSLTGNDPQGIRLTEDLARYLHQNSLIVGGLEVTVVRTGNPDGEANGTRTNANGVTVSREFPSDESDNRSVSSREPEVKAILQLLKQLRPQRVIHLRTYTNQQGLVAASSGATAAAEEVADWADLSFVSLPGRARTGTLERYLADGRETQVVTLAVPSVQDQSADDVWTLYRDAILNLLLDEDFQTRKLARERGQSHSARLESNRESTWGSDERAFDSDDGFSEFGEFSEN